jgi:peptidoglycan/LPS O-acetylase OafA/YrhL
MSSSMPPSHAFYRRDIDGIRALAVLVVVLFHAFPALLPGGFVGVDVFFVISGYLITKIVVDDVRAGRFTFRSFYARRVRRIFPALTVVLVACGAFGWFMLVGDELAQFAKHLAAGALSVANIKFWRETGYFDGAGDLKPLLHLWSLGVEEQFYLLWPLALVATRGRSSAIRRILGAIVASSLALSIWLSFRHPTAAFFLPFPRFWELGAGGILACAGDFGLGGHANDGGPPASVPFSPRARSVLSAFGAVLFLLSVFLLSRHRQFPGWALLPTSAGVLLIAGGPGGFVGRVLSSKPLVEIGILSYPLYLWHWPLLSFARILEPRDLSVGKTTALVVAAFALAWLTQRFVEKRLRRAPPSVPIVGPLVAAMAGIAVFGLSLHAGYLPRKERAASAFVRDGERIDDELRHRYERRPCDALGLDPETVKYCGLGGALGAARTIVLWGDSHAESWSPAFFHLGEKHGLRVVVFSHHGCPPLLRVRRTDPDAEEACRGFGLSERIVEAIGKVDPLHVFVAARWSIYTHGWRVHGVLQDKTHFVTSSPSGAADVESSRQALASRLGETLHSLVRFAPVTVIKTAPVLNAPVEQGKIRDPDRFEPTLAEYRDTESLADRLIDEAVRTRANLRTMDPAQRLCREKCYSVLDGNLVYRDDNHLTAQGALLFEDDLVAALSP